FSLDRVEQLDPHPVARNHIDAVVRMLDAASPLLVAADVDDADRLLGPDPVAVEAQNGVESLLGLGSELDLDRDRAVAGRCDEVGAMAKLAAADAVRQLQAPGPCRIHEQLPG